MDVSVFADESRGSFITTAMSGNRKPGALVRLARQEERYRMEDKNRTEEVKRLKNQIKQMKSQRRGQTLPRQLSTLGARPSSSLAEWAAFFQNSTDPHGCRARTAESSERFTPQIMQGRFLVTPPPGTGFALVMNPSQCCNNEIGPQPGAPAPVILAGTVALYTGVTDATTIFGTGSVPVPLAGQYTSVGGEAGVGWNRCLGYQLEIVQRATALTRGATCYTSSSDMYAVFTWDSPSATFVGAAVGSLLTQSHTKREQLGFEDSKETIRKVYPGFAEPKALFNYNSMSVPNAGGVSSIPHPELYPVSVGEAAPRGFTEFVVVLPYDTAATITYEITLRVFCESARFTPAFGTGLDPSYTVVPTLTWSPDPLSVAREKNALAMGRDGNPGGFRLNPAGVAKALGYGYDVAKTAFDLYRRFKSSRAAASPTLALMAPSAPLMITNGDDESGYEFA